jgi:hypothetical protein
MKMSLIRPPARLLAQWGRAPLFYAISGEGHSSLRRKYGIRPSKHEGTPLDKVRSIGRRSFLIRVAGGALVAGAAMAFGESEASARRRVRRQRMLVDADPSDPARPVSQSSHSVTGHGRTRHARPGPEPMPLPPYIGSPSGSNGPGPVSRFVICPGNARCPRRQR